MKVKENGMKSSKTIYFILVWTVLVQMSFYKTYAAAAPCEEVLNPVGLLDFITLTDLNSAASAELYGPDDITQASRALTKDMEFILEDIITDPAEATYRNTVLPVIVILDKFKKLIQLSEKIVSDLSVLESNLRELNRLEESKSFTKKREAYQIALLTANLGIKKVMFDLSELGEFRARLSAVQFSKTTNLSDAELFHIVVLIEDIKRFSLAASENPLLRPSNLDYGAIPFDKIKIEDFYPAVQMTYKRAKRAFEDLLLAKKVEPNFRNTIEALIHLDRDFERVQTVLYIYEGSYALPEYREELNQLVRLSESLSIDLQTQIFTNEDFFKRVQDVAQSKDLSPSQSRYVQDVLKSFDDSGFKLTSAERTEFVKLKRYLSELTTDYSNNVRSQLTLENFHVIVTDQNELAGLPDEVIQRAKSNAEKMGVEGWVFDSEIETLYAIYDYAESDELRKQYWVQRNSRNSRGDSLDNQNIVKEIVQARQKISQMLGYPTHSHRTLEDRMAKTPERVNQFLRDFLEKVLPKAKNELVELQTYKDSVTQENSKLLPWQISFWTRKLKEEKYNFDEKKLKPYLEVNRVLDGVFRVIGKLYGITFVERKDLPVYSSEVKAFEVLRGGEKLALLYVDLFSRQGVKRDGAWMATYSPQYRDKNGNRISPIVSVNANFTLADKGPTYISFDNAITLFHEMGHGIHGIASDVEIKGQSSPGGVPWDAVELPSQFMENFAYEREVLDMFAYNDEGLVLPQDLLEALVRSENFGSATSFLGQIKLGLVDMALYSQIVDLTEIDLLEFEQEATREAQLLQPTGLERPFSTSFSHIMSGGYSSGYYSYLWASVLDKDAYAAFKDSGDIFNPSLAKSFYKLLSLGGSKDFMQTYVEFRGQEPSVEPLLKSRKIID